MFASMNIIGNLGKDAEEKGEWVVLRVGFKPNAKKESLWATVRTKAKWCGALTRGTKVMVYGTPDFKVWESQQGNVVDITIFANNIVTLTPKQETSASSPSEESDVPF